MPFSIFRAYSEAAWLGAGLGVKEPKEKQARKKSTQGRRHKNNGKRSYKRSNIEGKWKTRRTS